MTAVNRPGPEVSLDEATAAWPHAVIRLRDKQGGAEYTRPAAFVFDAVGGFAWVEPQYVDPYGASSPALHVRQATIEPEGEGFRFDGPGCSGTIEPYEPSAEQLRDVGYCLERFGEWLAEEKKTAAEERAAVQAMIERDLAGEPAGSSEG